MKEWGWKSRHLENARGDAGISGALFTSSSDHKELNFLPFINMPQMTRNIQRSLFLNFSCWGKLMRFVALR